ncbi:MAG TPA: MFS transporter, partial [Rhodanobacteraceae bacterium]
GFDTDGVSLYMLFAILGGAALQWPLGYLSDHTDRRLALAGVGLLACVLAVGVGIAGSHKLAGTILMVAYCGMAFAIYPMVVAHLVDYLTATELLGASSSVYLIYGAGSALGPLIVGAGMTAWGVRALPVWFALMTGCLALYAAYRYEVFRREPVADNNFRALLRTTPVALRMARSVLPKPEHGSH